MRRRTQIKTVGLNSIRSRTQIKDAHAEQRMFVARAIFALFAVVALSVALTVRLIQLQVIQHERFVELSLGNSIRIQPLTPTRGLIYDRNGAILAENLPSYQLELIPEQVTDVDGTLRQLAGFGLVDEEDFRDVTDKIKLTKRFNPVVLRSRLSEEEIARFAVRRPRFPGVDIRARLIRHYPFGELGVHAVGYVGGLSVGDIEKLADPDNYAGTTLFGKTGVERAFEDMLHGAVGHHQLLTNARGRSLGSIPGESPIPGDNIYLNIDAELQGIAEQALAGRRGSVIAVDPTNGELLVLASTPAFDPNAFATRLRSRDYAALRDDLDRPLFNRALSGRYPPGSIIKPILGIAGLETHATSLTHRTFCRGSYNLPNSTHRYRDWKPAGHGLVDLHDAIAESCDVYFYEMSQRLGIDAIHEYLTTFGLGSTAGIDIPGEKRGIVPSRAWKKEQFSTRADQIWFPGETVIAAIGQGYMLATPLQLAQATAAIAMRGDRFQPRLLRHSENSVTGVQTVTVPVPLPSVQLADNLHWEVIVNSMRDVMQGENGTARAVGMNAPYAMAGKSGTAQVFSVAQEDEYDADEIDERLRDHALFIAFAPVENPSIAVAVIVENGQSGSGVAAPIARAVMDYWLLTRPAAAGPTLASQTGTEP